MADRLDGKVAVVTGGASGIGEGTVRLFAEEGARVVAADIQDDRGRAIVESIGTSAAYVHADVSEEREVEAAVAHAVERWGRIDAIFNNAGAGGALGGFTEVDEAGYEATMNLLVKGVFFGIKHAALAMRETGGGSIVNTASVAGLQAGMGPAIYSVGKGAVVHMTRAAAHELGEQGIRVNCICPGGIATPIFGKVLGLSAEDADKTVDAMAQVMGAQQPIKRAGMPRDIANAALWLASEDSSFVTGHALVVDGGVTLGRPRTGEFDEGIRGIFRAMGLDVPPGQPPA